MVTLARGQHVITSDAIFWREIIHKIPTEWPEQRHDVNKGKGKGRVRVRIRIRMRVRVRVRF